MCRELDEAVKAFLTRPIEGEHPYLWLDATFHKVRENGKVVSLANVVAIAVCSTGERKVLGIDVGPAEDHAFWVSLLRSLVARGLTGVRLVISDAHQGLKQAIVQVLAGASWQRCRVHFMRNLLATVPKAAQEAVAALVRTVFAQPDHEGAMAQLTKVTGVLRERFPKAADLLADAAEEVLAHLHFPEEHRRRLHSTDESVKALSRQPSRRAHVRCLSSCSCHVWEAGGPAVKPEAPPGGPEARSVGRRAA